MKNFTIACLLAAASTQLHAQEINYDNVSFQLPVPPVYPSLQQNISFDVRASITDKIKDSFLSQEEIEKMREIFQGPMKVTFGRFSEVDSTGDLHVVALIHRFKWVKPTPPETGLAADVVMHTRVYDKYGTLLYDKASAFTQMPVPSESQWGNSYDRKDPKTKARIATQTAISNSLIPFVNQIYGHTPTLYSKLAYLDDVKRKPELKPFEEQVNALRKTLRTDGLSKFLTASEAHMPYWEKMSNYQGEGEVNEVKRAALQNLALVHILKGNYEQAESYIKAYKPIDKQQKAIFGLVSVRNSDELESLMSVLQAKAENEIVPVSDKTLTNKEILSLNNYLPIKGTIVLDGKNAGTYQGEILVKRPEPQPIEEQSTGSGLGRSMGMLNLGADDILIQIPTTDKSGKAKMITVRSSTVKSLKGDDGVDYQFRKFGTVGIGDGAVWYMLKPDYQSAKLTLYRSMLPTTGEYVVMKPGDDKGVKSSLLNARKNVLDYLKDCVALDKYTKGAAQFDIKQVALDYTNCQ